MPFETESERKDRIALAASDARKHRGAIAGQTGYDFQDFVTLLRIIDLARVSLGHRARNRSTPNWKIDPATTKIKQNAPGTQIDDLRIQIRGSRLYVQIKKGMRWWSAKVADEFRKEKNRNEGMEAETILELCVSRRTDAIRLAVSRPTDLVDGKRDFRCALTAAAPLNRPVSVGISGAIRP